MRCFGFSPLRLPADLDFAAMFHGIDERVPIDGLRSASACSTGSSPAVDLSPGGSVTDRTELEHALARVCDAAREHLAAVLAVLDRAGRPTTTRSAPGTRR